jgi:hypothetical protein
VGEGELGGGGAGGELGEEGGFFGGFGFGCCKRGCGCGEEFGAGAALGGVAEVGQGGLRGVLWWESGV